MSGAGSRRRALLFALLAAGCAAASVVVAARYRDAGQRDYGSARPVLVVERALKPGEAIDLDQAERALAVREVPARFVPPDALSAPGEAFGARPRVAIPPGSYLLGSHLETEPARRRPLRPGLRPIDVQVSGAEALQRSGVAGDAGSRRVDVLAADEPGSTTNPRVRVLARRVPLLALRPLRRGAGIGEGRGWQATLALARRPALRVIEAENFAREIRLLPIGG